MPDNSQGIERKSSNETPKRRSFFGGKITEKTKDLLDFRYNTQEEIDKLNQEMTITDDLDEIMKKDSIINDINDENNIEEKDEGYFKEKDEKEAEANLEQNLQGIQESTNNDSLTNNEIYEEKSTPIEGEIVENPDTNDNEEKDSEENEKAEDKNIEELTPEETKNIEESNEKVEEENVEEKSEPEHEEITETSEETQPEEIIDNKQENEEAELGDSAKFFDPFELDLEDEENPDSKNENFDPFGLYDEDVEEEDIQDEENSENELKDEEPEDIIETSDESQPEEITEETENNEDKKEEEEIEDKREEKDEEDISEDNYDTGIINNDENENEEVSEDTTEIIEDENTKSENEEDEEDEDENENQNNEDLEVDEPIEEENENELEDETQIEDETEIEQENTIENEDEINTDENIENEIRDTNIEEINENDNKEKQQTIKTSKKEEDNEDIININTPIAANLNKKDENEETAKFRKVKKNSATGEVVTEEEIQLEQGQDTSNDEEDEEYQPTDEELFEYEPEFFANDELSQQFLILVQNARGIFKLEHKDGQQDPYFKILGGKSENSILEYLFYLIEEEDQPIDLYIKKVETNQESGEENEHLVQFSYNEDKELNIFVDEVILYEKINKSEPDTPGYNDTKAILEKFIFLTENHYQKLEDEINKQREERQKKRQLQQIFKGF